MRHIRERLGGVVSHSTNGETEQVEQEGIDRTLIDETDPTTRRINGQGSLFLRNESLGRYFHVNVYKEEDIWVVNVTYGKKGKKCKHPIIMRFSSRAKALAYANHKVREKTSMGYEVKG